MAPRRSLRSRAAPTISCSWTSRCRSSTGSRRPARSGTAGPTGPCGSWGSPRTRWPAIARRASRRAWTTTSSKPIRPAELAAAILATPGSAAALGRRGPRMSGERGMHGCHGPCGAPRAGAPRPAGARQDRRRGQHRRGHAGLLLDGPRHAAGPDIRDELLHRPLRRRAPGDHLPVLRRRGRHRRAGSGRVGAVRRRPGARPDGVPAADRARRSSSRRSASGSSRRRARWRSSASSRMATGSACRSWTRAARSGC